MLGRRKTLALCITLLCIVGTAFAGGCASSGASSPTTHSQNASTSGEPQISAQYAKSFPLQYTSLQQTRINEKGVRIGHSVDEVRDTCEAPVMRDQNGDPIYDESGNTIPLESAYNSKTGSYDINLVSDTQLNELNLKTGCVSCKTSRFNDIYAQQGAASFGSPYNAEARAIVADEYFDCAMCHEGEPSEHNIQPTLMYFQALGEGLADHLDERNGVCGQCHNSYDYRSLIHAESDLQTFRAYRNGYDVDGLFETCWEDGVNLETDETTGITESYLVHPTIELFMGTKMQMLGVTCTDCHMPKSVDEHGQEYTNHFAANSPLESEDSLTYCLSCHEQQGATSAAQMVEFVRGKEAEMAAGMAALQERKSEFRQVLLQRVDQLGKDNPTLNQAKQLYAKVSWYDTCLATGPAESAGSQAAMMDWESILEKANAACDEGMALLG